MHILGLIILGIVLAGFVAFGIFLFMARLGHKRAWKEYIEQDKERRARREREGAIPSPIKHMPED
ncbi:MAG: hypothetical protein ACO1NM_13565 [Sphingobium phenoxybenzoativorans]|uniref:Uncharacterized protein n=1 Tax=Sphingobium phenoxybenzoativorans TaxID=1592790 RepID=A0A975K5W5_9SPHN|nr:hypothetical protein [Sphingobium phenoxybenzoativorans]QUT04924.1 hypothetical protein KFK14_18150 [Sphingobium phenoxybenzoativorans]